MKTLLLSLSFLTTLCAETLTDTFTPFTNASQIPPHPHALWHPWNPLAEPLDTEVLHEWEEDGVVLQVIRFRVGVFKGEKAMLAAVYGYPKGARSVPGLLNIHGGGQYADYRACLTNAKRGYATISIAWAGRIATPDYTVTPDTVKLFWEGKTEDPNYKVTTDWGKLDGYHAPSKHGKDAFKSLPVEEWTIDNIESPRNSSWFLATMGARRALTFLQKQAPIVNPNQLGVYGHSMGGKLTVLTTASDSRVKAAAPSCGGVSDRYNQNETHQKLISDLPNLGRIKCPIIFLNPVNDFHANFQDFTTIPDEINSSDWRYSFVPQLSHEDIPEHTATALAWMDQHLKFAYNMPSTPETSLNLDSGTATMSVSPDLNGPVLSVDVYYTQQGVLGTPQKGRDARTNRHWFHARTILRDGKWTATLPLAGTDKPLWAYANVTYALPEPISGAGYYYSPYTTSKITISSRPELISAETVQQANITYTLPATNTIEDFRGDWAREWIAKGEWQISTNKLSSAYFSAPEAATLSLEVKTAQDNTLLVGIDDYYAEVTAKGGSTWQEISLSPADFKNTNNETLESFTDLKTLTLTDTARVKNKDKKQQTIGKAWQGGAPSFRKLQWKTAQAPVTETAQEPSENNDYLWTTDHMHVGVRWQPHGQLPECNAYDFQRDVISKDSSYVQFWVSWPAIEPTEEYLDYSAKQTSEMKGITEAAKMAKAAGKKVELVFYHVPAWASETGQRGGFKPKAGLYAEFIKRISTHFKDYTDAYQLYHEANLSFMLEGADVDFLIKDMFIEGAKAIKEVYGDKPVIISTSGCSPCEGCGAIGGLGVLKGAEAVSNYYDALIADKELMSLVNALNMNVSDQNDGSGAMDGSFISSTWDNYDLVRAKLDVEGLPHFPVISSESWVSWDGGSQSQDVNADGEKNELDAYHKTLTIMGQCLQRGLNTMNLPWSDNSSSWAMGLTKRVDYNGRVYQIRPEFTYPAIDGGPDVVTRKIATSGSDDSFTISYGSGDPYTEDSYAVPGDPNHLHYYIWRWYAQIAGGSDEVIRHAIAGEHGNDIAVIGRGFVGNERYKISSYNRTKKEFNVLLYASGASAFPAAYTKLTIPATIQKGKHYHTDNSAIDFRGEGLAEGATFTATVETKDICKETGQDKNVSISTKTGTVTNGKISFSMEPLSPFTKITIK